MMLGVTADAAVEELTALAGVQGVLVEILEGRNAVLEQRNADLEQRNEELSGQVKDLSGQLADVLERMAKLERQNSRNSGNSGMAPSSDDLPGRTAPDPKPKRERGTGKKKQGKQPGAPGAHLAWTDAPDDRKPLFPRGECDCGRGLDEALDLGIARSHQVIDTPVVTATVTQYDEHAVQCRCGKTHVAEPPAGAGEAGTVTYGLNLQAWVVFLLVMHHVPVERCAQVIGALAGTRPSDGFVHSMIARAAAAVRGVNMLIRALVITASVISADETPIRVGPGPKTKKKYLLVACTNLLTYFYLGDRSMKTFDCFVFPDMSGAVIVHGRYRNYVRHEAHCYIAC
jgi:transposase